jgi:hypothetical protein
MFLRLADSLMHVVAISTEEFPTIDTSRVCSGVQVAIRTRNWLGVTRIDESNIQHIVEKKVTWQRLYFFLGDSDFGFALWTKKGIVGLCEVL